jgi:hypothetical protein
MLYFKSCPRCQGDVYVDADAYGAFAKCLQCGFARDLPSVEALKKALRKKVEQKPAEAPAALKKAA